MVTAELALFGPSAYLIEHFWCLSLVSNFSMNEFSRDTMTWVYKEVLISEVKFVRSAGRGQVCGITMD